MRGIGKYWFVHALLLAGFAVLGLRAVDEPRSDFRFAILGDRTGGAQPQIYGRVWREIDLFRPDFVINVGDTIEGRDDGKALQEWTELRPIWQRYGRYPHYFTAGNHDIWSEYSRQLYEQESGREAIYSFTIEDAHFTVLDTAETGQLTDEQLGFLDSDLEQNAGKDPKFVFFHHPYWLARFRGGDADFRLHELAKKHRVHAVISGHGHQFVRMVRDGIVYMEVGSSGGTMAGGFRRGEGFRDGRFYHWVWGHVNGREVSFTVKEIDGQMGAGRSFDANDWDEDGPKFDTGDPALTYEPET